MWVPILLVVAAAAVIFTFAAASAAEQAGLPQPGTMSNGKITGDWVMVPKGLLKGELLRKLNIHMWSNHVNGVGPLMAFDKWRKASSNACRRPDLDKMGVRYTFVPNEPALPPAMYDLLPGGPKGHILYALGNTKTYIDPSKTGPANWGELGGGPLPATDERTWPWGINCAQFNMTVFPPAAGFISPEHREAWIRHAECWLTRKTWGKLTYTNKRLAKDGQPKHSEYGPHLSADDTSGWKKYETWKGANPWTGVDPWYYPVPATSVTSSWAASGALKLAFQCLNPTDDNNVSYLYWSMCCTLAQLRVLPFAEGMRPFGVAGAMWNEFSNSLHKMWNGKGVPATSRGPSGALKGLSQGASVFAGMFGKGAVTGWAAGAIAAAANLAKQLEGKGGAKWLWWHDDWTPVAIPRAVIGSAVSTENPSMLNEWDTQSEMKVVAATYDFAGTQKWHDMTGKEVEFRGGKVQPVVKADFGSWGPVKEK